METTEQTASPELKRILGAVIFAASHPPDAEDLRKCLREVAAAEGADTSVAVPSEKAIRAALAELAEDLLKVAAGLHLVEVAGGYQFQTDPACGTWVRNLLKETPPRRLSRPALETLAIIAYRQPITRVEIEAIRGVNADYIMRVLMESEMVRIVGRSDLPGRPMLYGTTRAFLEHFGLDTLQSMPAIDELARIDRARKAASEAVSGTQPQPEPESPASEPPKPESPAPESPAPEADKGAPEA